jgi:hypothetical protein
MVEYTAFTGRRLFHWTGPLSYILSFLCELERIKMQAIDKDTYNRTLQNLMFSVKS